MKIAAENGNHSGHFVAEGTKLISEGLSSKATLTMLLQADGPLFFPELESKSILLPPGLMKKISGMVNPASPIGIFKLPEPENFQNLLQQARMLVILDRIQDPGNLGTILRTCLSMNVDAVLLLKGCCSPFNQKVVRSSMGAVFHIPVYYDLQSGSTIDHVKSAKITCISTCMNGKSIFDLRFPERCALFFGHEGKGLKKEIKKECSLTLAIPMQGKVESLNVAASAAICLYEWARQQHIYKAV